MHENKKNLLDGSLAKYNDAAVPKIPVFAGSDITSEVYYFKPNQVLNAHRHPNGEQIFVFLKGKGKMKLGEHECDVKDGDTIFVPTGEWHEITNGSKEEMVAVQITKINAGAEYRG
ncbi:cupin domain-containing protein [Clostridioides difficile]|nr:cupin domain-containing protein [Clostridioides difficile]